MNNKVIIPLKFIENRIERTWFIDVTLLGIEELIKLRKSLEGFDSENTIAIIDKLIYTKYVGDFAYNNLQGVERRRVKRSKERKQKKLNKYKGGN